MKSPSLWKGFYKIIPVHLFICLCVCHTFFSGSTQWMFLFFCMRIFAISLGRVELFYLFVASIGTSMEATVLSCHFSWLGSGMPKVF